MTWWMWVLAYLSVGCVWAFVEERVYHDYRDYGSLIEIFLGVFAWLFKLVFMVAMLTFLVCGRCCTWVMGGRSN